MGRTNKDYQMNKKIRQYIGLAVAVLMYYLIHEGAHLAVALAQGVFKQINVMGMGVPGASFYYH